MSTRLASRLSTVALTLVLAGGLVACGGGDSDAAQDAAAKLDAATAGATSGTDTDDAPNGADDDATSALSIPSAGAGAEDINVDPCTLLTEDDVATAFNESNPQWPVADFSTTTEDSLSYMPDGVACQILWDVENAAGGSFVVQLMPADDDNWELAKGIIGTPKSLNGIGDEAFVNSDNTSWARVGDLIVGIVNTNTSASSTALLKRAAANL